MNTQELFYLNDKVDKKENKSTWVSYTLAANQWTLGNDNLYHYDLSGDYANNAYDIANVLPNASTTDTMRAAWVNANCGGYEPTNMITCHGIVPTIDIVIGLCVKAKGGSL